MSRYDNATYIASTKLDVENKRRYYDSLLDPDIPISPDDIYVVCTIGERLDLLAYKYYSDATLWWIIAAANPALRKDSMYIEPGTQVRVPADFQSVLELTLEQNTTR
jgi:hypothetical protein